MALKIQNENIKSSAELIADGGTAAQLPNDTKIYVTANSLNKTLYQAVVDGDLAGGGGAGSPDTIFEINADDYTSLSGWATGDGTITDGSALPGGTLQGTFELVTSSPAEGTQHFRFTQAAGSLDTYFLSDAQTVAEIWRGKDVGCNVSCKYDGSDNDIYVIVFDATNNRRLTSTDFYVKASSTYRNYQMVFTIPSSCTSIRVGFQVRALNSGKILNFDKFSLFDRPFVMANVNDVQSLQYAALQNTFQDLTQELRFPSGLTTASFSGAGILRIEDDSANTRTKFTALRACVVDANLSMIFPGSGYVINIYKNGSVHVHGSESYAANSYASTSAEVSLAAGDYITFRVNGTASSIAANAYLNIVATAQNESVITPARVMDPVIYTSNAGQSIPDASATIVNFEDVEYDSESHVTTGASWKFTAKRSGFYDVSASIIYAGASSWVSGDVALLKLFKNGVEVYNSQYTYVNGAFTGSITNQLSTDIYLNAGDYIDVRAYQDSAGAKSLAASTAYNRISITAQNSYPLVATPIDRVAYIKDVKAALTNGGSSSAGANTRVLNTTSGDVSFVDVASNQFRPVAGTYDIEADSPAYRVDRHHIYLYNATAASEVIIGSAEYASAADNVQNRSSLVGRFVANGTDWYEIRHFTQLAVGTSGLGTSNDTRSGVFTQVKIKKIK